MDNGGVEALLHKLQTHDLSEFNVREYPITKGLLKQKQLSLTSVAKWWQELLIEGDGYVAAVGYGSHAGIFGTVTAQMTCLKYIKYSLKEIAMGMVK